MGPLDLAGRLVLVMYNAFQTTLGQTGDAVVGAGPARRATEAQAPVLLAGSAVAYVVGPTFLGAVMPRYVEGLPALRPLLPGMILLGLAWPARQMLIAVGRPYLLFLTTVVGFVATNAFGIVGADRGGFVGVAWAMSAGYATLFLLTSAASALPFVCVFEWLAHLGRLACWLLLFAVATVLTAYVPIGISHPWADAALRALILAIWLLPVGALWAHRHGWGGLRNPRSRSHHA